MAGLAERAIETAGRMARWGGADTRLLKDGQWTHVAARAAKGGAHVMDVSVRKEGQGFDGCVILPEDHMLNGFPHRTGSRGSLEPIEERIFRGVSDEDGFAAFRACVERAVARIPGGGDNAAHELAGRIAAVAESDPDAVRLILAGVLREALDPAEVARISEAFDAAAPSLPTPR